LQKLQLETEPLTIEHESEILKLRQEVPAPVLAHMDRLIARGKKAVSAARHGVCSECHLRITSGTLASLAYANDIHLCDNCGRYLYLAEDEPVAAPVKESSRKPRRSMVAHAV